ncbi:PadR family transcriptional regulator [uncultured Gemmiger sp.]|uniref:PadR family transcriptional regulator n=1 Tax=uncultured Gemmiger sp. TaxID=1623490 RepID=UPI0025D3AEF8|nr:PadR family transcriptional regulator [uncultured Gemmiger sp.]
MDDRDDKFEQQFKKGALEMVLLALIARRRTYGYEIIQQLGKIGAPLFSSTREGTLYPLLYRLEDAGLVAGELEATPGGRAKKYYRITEAGRAALKRRRAFWLMYKGCIDSILEG